MGFHRAGFTTLAAVEIDKDAAEAFAVNVQVEPMVRDIRDVSLQDMQASGVVPGELTLLFGCPPCQSFTVLRRGAEPTEKDLRRNALVLEYLRLVEELRPRHIAFENVPGLVEGKRWRPHFDRFQEKLDELGYRLAYAVLDAAEYGVPQRRRRVLAIGSRVTAPELPGPSHGPNGTEPFATVRSQIEGLPKLAAGEGDPSDPFHRARRHSALAVERLTYIPEGGGRTDLPDHLVLDCHRNHNGHYDIYGRMWWDRVAPTLTSGCTNVTRGRFAHPEQDRAITLREAMLLQTFRHDAVLRGGVEAMALQVGNAVPSLLAQRIGEQVIAMEQRSRCADFGLRNIDE